ncbi:MAG: HlyD family efflux transporter periplasmic adaptor subunit [Pedobacter sp.]|nr:HlyD family efflux transporter periplasmic adaptor subunit [Pedobacter sp.]
MHLVFVHRTRVRSQIIYSITLLAVILAIGALPFLYITISVKGEGIIKSNLEKIELLAPASGRILNLNLKDNQKVIKGTVLLTINGTLSKQQDSVISDHSRRLNQQLRDIEVLINVVNKKWKNGNGILKTGLYIASWQQYTGQLQNAVNFKQQSERIFQRYQTLYHKKVVTKSEFEEHKFNYQQALSDEEMVNKNHKIQWQSDAIQYRRELSDLQYQKAQINEQEKKYSLSANINGSIQSLTGLQEGSYIYANQKIGEISPDGTLFAYCYVKPTDIGLIKKGQHVRVQVDAFNYNQWGVLLGKVIDISDDIIIRNQVPYFKIKCQLNRNYLQLKSGYKGFIRKGMTFTANFAVSKRSLYQLLYDKVDDWIN